MPGPDAAVAFVKAAGSPVEQIAWSAAIAPGVTLLIVTVKTTPVPAHPATVFLAVNVPV